MTVEAPSLEVVNLVSRYGRREILGGVSFSLDPGALCGLLGPNGSGKTTLFRCILKFHNDFDGEVHICGQNLKKMPPKKIARLISYVPQDHRAVFPFTVREIVAMGRSPLLGSAFRISREHEMAVEKALEHLGLQGFAHQPWNALSGGQRQLALIARAVAQEAPVMLLDEPTSALDFKNQIEVWRVLAELSRLGFAILICCHDPNHILWHCSQAVLLNNGSVIASGKPENALTKSNLQALYGGICQMATLPDGRQTVYPAACREKC